MVCPTSSRKQIGNQNLSRRKFQHVEIFFADFAGCPDLIRNRRLSVFIGVCPSLSQSILIYWWRQIGVCHFVGDQNRPLDQLESLIAVALNDGAANLWDDPGDAHRAATNVERQRWIAVAGSKVAKGDGNLQGRR